MQADTPRRDRTWQLSVSTQVTPDGAEVTVTGRLGHASAAELRVSLESPALGAAKRVVLDLAGVDYVSSAGISVIHDAAARLRARDGELTIRGASEPIRLVLSLAGLSGL